MDFATIKKAVLAGFAWQGLTKVVVQTTSWGATIFVARLIAPSDYGIVAAAGVVTQLLVLLTELGLAQGLIQKKEISAVEEDSIFYISLSLGLLLYGLLFLSAPLIAHFYEMAILTEILRIGGLVIVFGALKTIPLAIAMRRMDFRYRSLVEMGSGLCMTVTVLLLAINGFGVWSLVWGPVVAQAFMAICYLPLLARIPVPRLSLPPGVFQVISLGLKMTFTHLLYFAWSRADVLVIARTLGERMLGYYSMAFQLAVLPLDKVGSIFNQVLFPAMARLQDSLRESQSLFLELHRYLLIITCPMLFGLAAIADDFVIFLLTETWAPIVPVLQVLCLVSAFRVSGMLMPSSLYARGKPGAVMRYSGMCLLVLPPSFLIGAQFGLQGIVLAWVIVYPFLYWILARACLRDLQLSWLALVRSMMPALSSSVLMVLAVLGFRAAVGDDLSLGWRVFASIGLGASVYLTFLAVLYREHIATVKQRLTVLRTGGT